MTNLTAEYLTPEQLPEVKNQRNLQAVFDQYWRRFNQLVTLDFRDSIDEAVVQLEHANDRLVVTPERERIRAVYVNEDSYQVRFDESRRVYFVGLKRSNCYSKAPFIIMQDSIARRNFPSLQEIITTYSPK